MKRKSNLDDLRWQRLFIGSLIPRYLVEQIAKRDYEVDTLYKYIDRNILKMSPDGPTLNHLFQVWALVNPENLVRGFLWFTIDPLTLDILIQVYSVDSNYWGCKAAVHKLAEHVKSLRKGGDLKKIFWITKFPKHSLKYGFKPSKCVLMEYNEEEENNGTDLDGKLGADEPLDSGTTAVLQQCAGGSGEPSG